MKVMVTGANGFVGRALCADLRAANHQLVAMVRTPASTILNEHGFRPDVIERQLAHAERNGVRKAYNHAQYLPERRKMMQWWADYLDDAAKPSRIQRRHRTC